MIFGFYLQVNYFLVTLIFVIDAKIKKTLAYEVSSSFMMKSMSYCDITKIRIFLIEFWLS